MDFQKYFGTAGIKGKVQMAIASDTAKALRSFCEQEAEFAQAIEQSGRTFQQCLDSIVKGVHASLSDFEAYSRAVEFYFPGAKVIFQMRIDLIGDGAEPALADSSQCAASGTKVGETSALTLSFDSLLDF